MTSDAQKMPVAMIYETLMIHSFFMNTSTVSKPRDYRCKKHPPKKVKSEIYNPLLKMHRTNLDLHRAQRKNTQKLRFCPQLAVLELASQKREEPHTSRSVLSWYLGKGQPLPSVWLNYKADRVRNHLINKCSSKAKMKHDDNERFMI